VADDHAWPAILARSLPNNRVINLSLGGAGPQQYLRIYETFGTKLHPKLLLVGFDAQTDFWDAEMFDRWLKSGTAGNFEVWRDYGRPGRSGFSLHEPIASMNALLRSNLYPLVKESRSYRLLQALRSGVEGELVAPVKILRLPNGNQLQLMPGQFFSKTDGAEPDHPQFRLVLDALRRIDSIAKSNGTHALIVFQPGKEEVYLPLLGEPVHDPTAALRKALEGLGIEYLDLAPGFRQRAATGEQLFYEVDSHPNEAGYALTARLVRAHIKQKWREYSLQN
jgi:hypothetical protein